MRLEREGSAEVFSPAGKEGFRGGLFSHLPRKKLSIALLSYRSNPYCGGQGIYIKHLSQALRDRGHRVDVISGEPYPELAPGVGLIPLPGMNFYGYERFRDAVKDRGISSLRDLREWLSVSSGGFPEPRLFGERVRDFLLSRPGAYDVVHDNQSLCFGLLDLQSHGIPVISTIHHPITRDLGFALAKEERWGIRLLIRRWHSFLRMQKKVAPRLERIVTVSSASQGDIARDLGVEKDRIQVVPNGVDTGVFRPRPEITPQLFRIMATASADVPIKGLDYLIRAVHLLRREFPQIELRVLGKPKRDGNTQALISKLGLQDSVSFCSGLTQEEISREYAMSQLAAVPSLYEGFGLPAAEAMACGKPLVSTTGGALPEIVGDAGELVPTADSQALASALGKLLRHPDYARRLGRRARERIERHFTWASAASGLEEVYFHLAEKRAFAG